MTECSAIEMGFGRRAGAVRTPSTRTPIRPISRSTAVRRRWAERAAPGGRAVEQDRRVLLLRREQTAIRRALRIAVQRPFEIFRVLPALSRPFFSLEERPSLDGPW
jgi:hypothetical protein